MTAKVFDCDFPPDLSLNAHAHFPKWEKKKLIKSLSSSSMLFIAWKNSFDSQRFIIKAEVFSSNISSMTFISLHSFRFSFHFNCWKWCLIEFREKFNTIQAILQSASKMKTVDCLGFWIGDKYQKIFSKC